MAAARRLSELLQEQQEPFLVEAARARRPRRVRGASAAAEEAGGGLGYCPTAVCRRLLRLCSHGFKKRSTSGLRSALTRVLCSRAMRWVLRWDGLGGGCLSRAASSTALQRPRLWDHGRTQRQRRRTRHQVHRCRHHLREEQGLEEEEVLVVGRCIDPTIDGWRFGSRGLPQLFGTLTLDTASFMVSSVPSGEVSSSSQHGCDYRIMGGPNGNTVVLATKSTVVNTTGERAIFDFLFLALLAVARSLDDSLMCFLNRKNTNMSRCPSLPPCPVAATLVAEPESCALYVSHNILLNTIFLTAPKIGVDPSGCVELAKHVRLNSPNLVLSGLMIIGMLDYSSTPKNFKALANCREEVCKELGIPEEQGELFVGMSSDFEQAVREIL
ncbi:Proline synthase co-transcribed bacterial homolog protein [Zea mays]|uniref:Proline synthase co-transcribed bacterial homolog protein n=1 Tax=Zea mays TaxID=4577 RepID=A0A1D6EHL0_MAIZE|nr:Proline synthase co-transcribed bacterial homolog protein [Zea mays]